MRSLRPRRDPAPSLLRYRMGRLWLRPGFRRLVVVGPWLILFTALSLYAFTSVTVRGYVNDTTANVREAFVGREEFRISKLEIFGASEDLKETVEQIANLDLPMSSMDVDIAALRSHVEALSNVSDAAVRLEAGGVLQISLSQRVPAIIWRSPEGLRLIDQDGVELGRLNSRLERTDLPLIVGKGADRKIAEALEIFEIAGLVGERVRGLQRVGERRWTLVLDRDQAVYLPEKAPKSALRRVMILEASEGLFEKDIRIVDMRDGIRPVLRLGSLAQEYMRPQKMLFEGDQ